MQSNVIRRMNMALERYLPEQRLFLRSETETRFIRLSPGTQLVALTGCAAIVGWSIIASAMLIMDTIGAGSLRDQARREQAMYEERLNALAGERDLRAEETRNAQNRFNLALTEVSKMQSALLASEDRRKELETGIEVIQSTLRRTMSERDTALAEAENLTVALAESTDADKSGAGHAEDMRETVAFLSEALNLTATERDTIAAEAAAAYELAGALDFDRQLSQDRNDRIFGQLEDALTISIEPLDKMFRSAGLNTDTLIEQVRRGYSGQGGPLTPLSVSTKGELTDPETLRANGILDRLDQLNLYRIAAEKTPFSLPLKSSFRFTSGFGARWGRMHNGTDFAASYGTPIYSTADGVVIHAGWMSGYGRVVKIQHEFGIETRYAHMSKIHVTVGQRVSRGDRIGDMGNSGRSTGTHLHYEVRVGGKPVNPMIYIKAARDVF
ncbi:MAG: M23 family metallopeptidase [Pseudomonadota bacterium]|uniref:M23 family metallopeptidase n=1 Tax=Actibacterium sp. TaxID=1872125 RepID=UPI002580D06A|nr:M23 family metallopeptidase [Actibacterium sp.]MDY6857800.1 M23 family metallopeptidase [Pseudomonadota bacterium]